MEDTRPIFSSIPARRILSHPAQSFEKSDCNPVGKTVYELANGAIEEYEYGLAEITFMGEITAGRIIFGPDDAERYSELRRSRQLESPSTLLTAL